MLKAICVKYTKNWEERSDCLFLATSDGIDADKMMCMCTNDSFGDLFHWRDVLMIWFVVRKRTAKSSFLKNCLKSMDEYRSSHWIMYLYQCNRSTITYRVKEYRFNLRPSANFCFWCCLGMFDETYV